jgi:hypothetical protein
VVICGFLAAGYMVNSSLEEWAESPTITTLDSIAAPITKLQFPTVTVCTDRYTPPDNWAYVETVLNTLSFECNANQEVPCDDTMKVRTDFKQILEGLLKRLEALVNTNKDVVPGQKFISPTLVLQTGILVADRNLSFSDLRRAIINNFGVVASVKEALAPLADFSKVDLSTCAAQCKAQRNIVGQVLRVGDIMLKTSQRMPFGSFLRNFGNLSKEASSLSAGVSFEDLTYKCGDLKKMDNFLHGYFTELAHLVEIEKNLTVSLFDIPSMISLLDDASFNDPTVRQAFLYTHCNNDKKLAMHFDLHCYGVWNEYMSGKEVHPCDLNPPEELCCNFWTKLLNLNTVMKIMRLAGRRGRNVLNVQPILEPFLNNSESRCVNILFLWYSYSSFKFQVEVRFYSECL